MEGAAVALGVTAKELLDVLSILDNALLVAVVAVDEYDQMTGNIEIILYWKSRASM